MWFPPPPPRTGQEYSGSPSDFRASTRSNSLRRHNTPDKKTQDRGEINLNCGPCGTDESKKAERASESKDLPSYLGGAVFQNGSACFRLHVGHSAGEAAEGEGCCGGGGCGCNPGMLLISHRKTTHGNDSSQKKSRSGFSSAGAAKEQQVPSSCGTGSQRWRPIVEHIYAACKDQVRHYCSCAKKRHKSHPWLAMSRLNTYFSVSRRKNKPCIVRGKTERLKCVLITQVLYSSSYINAKYSPFTTKLRNYDLTKRATNSNLLQKYSTINYFNYWFHLQCCPMVHIVFWDTDISTYTEFST